MRWRDRFAVEARVAAWDPRSRIFLVAAAFAFTMALILWLA